MAAAQYLAALLSLFLLRIFTRFEIVGQVNLKKVNRPFILVANHESHIDPQLIGVALLKYPNLFPVRYMAKNQLFYIPGLNILMLLLGAFLAHKKKGIGKSLLTPIKILEKKGGVIMFPEGHIVPARPQLGSGRRGAAILALTTGAQLVPVSLHTPHDLPPIIPFTVDRPRVVIRIGEPFYLSKLDYPDFTDEHTYAATQVIMDKIAQLYHQHQY